MAKDPAVLAHQEWLGYVQPVGLVVSIPAMLDANLRVNQNSAPDHRRFLEALPSTAEGDPISEIDDFPRFTKEVLGWTLSDLCGAPGSDPVPVSFEVALPEYNETLQPTYALRDFDPDGNDPGWILLVKVLPNGARLDDPEDVDSRQWQASPQAKFERLLRQTRVSIGLLANGEEIRLVYAPEKELSGYATFKLSEMLSVAGRPIFAAFHMLLNSERLYSVAKKERLPAILENSRRYQNVVSTQLANQVLEALYELLRGFQAADDQAQGLLLRDVLAADPDRVYRGLLTTLLRMVFILYAEDRSLLSTDEVFIRYYSITGLYERLKVDDGRYPDTMDQRFGAWAQLLTLFRLVYRGGSHGGLRIPAREGYLFDHDRYLFLEGRSTSKDPVSVPRVPDGVLFRVLSKLMLLDGERISYRTLAVEQIGSVYEAIMGFELHVASGPSIAIKPVKRHGAPATINLEELLRAVPDKRSKWFTDKTDQKITGQAAEALKSATDINGITTALDRKIASAVTPGIVAKGAMIFQPSDERRRSGSHYTPRSLTGPIVEAALAPVLKQLGEKPTPAQILNLKVCDPAMGSGAFLVEACRQLGEVLVLSWRTHDQAPALPFDEDELLHAQRQIAQRCLYGVDKNPMAADLAKLSLWLATLAKDHPFTFLDHSLRSGDSLVGLTRQQIAAFNWEPSAQITDFEEKIRKKIESVNNFRRQIFESREDVPYATLRQKLDGAEDALSLPRQIGDAVVAAFFAGEKTKARERRRAELLKVLVSDLKTHGFIPVYGAIDKATAELKAGPKGVNPFHWELEFPEVFRTGNHGFDVFVGNPPFLGGARVWPVLGGAYCDYIRTIHVNSGGKAVDLVAHFFRRAFELLRPRGVLGFIATNTIAQGDTREAGLKYICMNGGTIFEALRRYKWTGAVSVIVSIVWIDKGLSPGEAVLDGKKVAGINSNLFPTAHEFNPGPLAANAGKSYQGTVVYGMGFTFDDKDTSGVASSISTMNQLIARNPKNRQRIFPFIGGSEVNSSPTHEHHRYIINFADFDLEKAAEWPELLAIAKEKVKPERDKLGGYSVAERRGQYWWQYGTYTPALYNSISNLRRVLVSSKQAYVHFATTFLPANCVFAHSLVIFASETFAAFCAIQSRVHEIWARTFSGTALSLSRYNPSDCFLTFPFVNNWEQHPMLEAVGKTCFEFRAQIMLENKEGLTDTYHRLNDPSDQSSRIQQLRALHDSMDRAVLDAYGWTDIQPKCEFIVTAVDEDSEDETESSKKEKYTYRWSDDAQEEVLTRLLDLNRQRATEERHEAELQPITWEKGASDSDLKPKRGRRKNASNSGTIAEKPTLFNTEEQEV